MCGRVCVRNEKGRAQTLPLISAADQRFIIFLSTPLFSRSSSPPPPPPAWRPVRGVGCCSSRRLKRQMKPVVMWTLLHHFFHSSFIYFFNPRLILFQLLLFTPTNLTIPDRVALDYRSALWFLQPSTQTIPSSYRTPRPLLRCCVDMSFGIDSSGRHPIRMSYLCSSRQGADLLRCGGINASRCQLRCCSSLQ